MIKLKSELPTRPHRHWARWLVVLLVVVPLAGLLEERWRGQWALHSWQRNLAAKGESLAVAPLWPPASAESVVFSNQLARVINRFPPELRAYAGKLSPLIPTKSGQAHRGSQAVVPPLTFQTTLSNQANTWKALDALLQESQPALQELRTLLKDPPPGINYDAKTVLDGDAWPNFVSYRIAAQTLHTAALNELHKGDLAGATDDLAALLSVGKVGEQDPGLVACMIRMAILGLSIDLSWDALQAADWTEPQLAVLQTHCLDITNRLSQLPRALEAERVARIHTLGRFRSHSYQAWVARYVEMYSGFGMTPAPGDVAPVVLWRRQWLFHPIWSFAWADQEELNYLRAVQPELTALRETSRQPSYRWLQAQLSSNRQNYRPPVAAGRFYGQLPLVDRFGEVIGPSEIPESAYPYPDFSRAWFTSMKNLTQHEMVITVIALKRHALRHGQPPRHLVDLVPEFLPALPIDLMDGQPLRYRLNPDGMIVLYSVGDNLQDDGGDGIAESAHDSSDASPWNGRDWVWPESLVGP